VKNAEGLIGEGRAGLDDALNLGVRIERLAVPGIGGVVMQGIGGGKDGVCCLDITA
jgi:hypothetical protein